MPAVASDTNALPNAISTRAGRPQRPQASGAGERDASSPFAMMLDATAPVPNRAPRKAAPPEPSAPARPAADATVAADQTPVRKTAEGTDSDAASGKDATTDEGDLPDTTGTGIDSEATQDDPAAIAATPPAAPQPEPIAAAVTPPVAADIAAQAEGETVANAAPALTASTKPQADLQSDTNTAEAGKTKAAASPDSDLNTDLPVAADDDPQAKAAKADASPRMASEPNTARAEPTDKAARPEPQKADPAQKAAAMHAETPQPDPATPPQQPAHHAMLATAQDAGPARAMTAQMTAQTPVPVSGLAVEIATLAKAGNHRFEIRLDPQELGRIDVRLDVDKDGNVKSRLIIERADTYDLLRRDASTLERALQQAGLKTSDHGLEFTLRDQSSMQRDAREHMPRNAQQTIIPDADILPEQAASGYSRLLGTGSGIDIRI